jgi:uncharacterized protein
MKYLIDTNVWLETLLRQINSNEVEAFLNEVPSENMIMSDFSLHSIGVILTKLNKKDAFIDLVDDLFINGEVSLVSLKPSDMDNLIQNMSKLGLDFDDAYQYACAKKFGLEIVTFDKDFKHSNIKIHRPSKITKLFNDFQ